MKGFSVFLFAALLASLLCVGASAGGGDISPALYVLRGELTMNKCGIAGDNIKFSEEDFQSLYGSTVNFITVTSLPDESEGKLSLNGVQVIEGQTISAASLSYLEFIPASEEVGECSFTFKSRASGWENTDVSCIISLSESENLPPVTSGTTLATVENVPVSGTLDVTDPDGDEWVISIEKYPENGMLEVREDGSVLYTPLDGYTGTDGFVYRATDTRGNSSADATVTVEVGENESGIVFSDMEKDEYLSAALEMSEKEIMTYKLTAGEYTFEPDELVSRVDFVVMLMTALDMTADLERDDAVFADLDGISAGRRAYLAEAADLGIVPAQGTLFKPLDAITFDEAAEFAAGALKDSGIEAADIFSSGDEAVTKKDAALMLQKILRYTEKD